MWGLVLALLLHSSVSAQQSQPLVPEVGAYFGVSVDLGKDTVASYVSRTGLEPAVYNIFIPLPLDQNATEYLPSVLPQFSEEQAVVMLTVMPSEGLDAVTADAVAELASYILPAQQVDALELAVQTSSEGALQNGTTRTAVAGWSTQRCELMVMQAGASVMIRFGHEMNGNWCALLCKPLQQRGQACLCSLPLRFHKGRLHRRSHFTSSSSSSCPHPATIQGQELQRLKHSAPVAGMCGASSRWLTSRPSGSRTRSCATSLARWPWSGPRMWLLGTPGGSRTGPLSEASKYVIAEKCWLAKAYMMSATVPAYWSQTWQHCRPRVETSTVPGSSRVLDTARAVVSALLVKERACSL